MSWNHEPPAPRLPERPRGDEDLVARLVRLADAEPSPPPGETERLKARLRPLWRQEVRVRARRRLLWTAEIGTLAAAAALLVVVGRAPLLRAPVEPPAAPVATVTSIVGRADVTPLSGVRAPWGWDAAGREVAGGTLLQTGASDRLALRLAGGQSLRVDVRSTLRIDGRAAVTLERGAAYLDSPAGAAGAVVVRTALGEVREIGTQFEARLEGGELTVRVREGSVVVSRGGESLTVENGFAVSVAPGRAPVRRAIGGSDEAWQWTQVVAPLLDIEGTTAMEFLAWVARESGIEVAWADAAAERVARAAVLHGALVGATPLDTLPGVLQGCGLRSELTPGRAVVAIGTAGPR